MKIGIPFRASPSIYGSGSGQAILTIAYVCQGAGHEVTLLQVTDKEWWDDAKGLTAGYTIKKLTQDDEYDLLIDVDGMVSPDLRCAKKVVVFFRSDPSFEYLEKAAYMSEEPTYSLQGVHEVWVWDVMVGEERVPLIQTMMEGLPVRRLPYVWTSDIVDNYLRGQGGSLLPPQVDLPEGGQGGSLLPPCPLIIAEKNNSNTSSCLIPLLGVAKATNVNEILLCNALDLEHNRFFQDNLIQKGAAFKSPIVYHGRLRYADLVSSPCILVSHLRHVPIRPGLIEALWLGIPLIHNCELLKDFGMYYAENDVDGIAKAIDTFSIEEYRSKRVDRETFTENQWSIHRGLNGWRQILSESGVGEPVLRIGFTNMWQGFDVNDNFFLDLMHSVKVKGSAEIKGADLVICGPFGPLPSVEKSRLVYYSGEPPMMGECDDSRVDLYLTHSPIENERQMRLPMWPLFVEWFGKSGGENRNPNRMPKELTVQPFSGPKTEFCAFVVSNPLSAERNAAFETVNAYKRVNSGGAFMNNIGGPLKALYAGGGGGDQVKVEFLNRHQFCICYENCVAPGYVTEKLLHAKMAGCIPLYRGSEDAVKDFNPNGFVHVKDGMDIVQLIKDLEADPERAAAIAATPALDPVRYAAIQERLQIVGRRLIELATTKVQKKGSNQIVQPIVTDNQNLGPPPVFTSFATEAYIPSLLDLLKSVEHLRKKNLGIQMVVYVGDDVTDFTVITNPFPWTTVRRLGKAPTAFPDMFEPKMFGWKLWLLHAMCHDPMFEGTPIIYADAGSNWLALPRDMLSVIQQSGVCLIKDKTQINRTWCQASMVQEMGLTEAELAEHQLMAGFVGFQGGHPAAQRLFDEALMWGSKKSCLFGPYVAGVGTDGKPFGHRHDQSILSILALRQHVPTLDSMRFVNETSVRKAYQKSTPIYLHRGNPVTHKQVLPGIDDLWVISLDRRPDRWQSLMLAHPGLLPIANRLPGIDGKLLQLTPAMANLFAKNDFKWKKSVTGCALSHILTWAQLASEPAGIKNYLILEDDCRFVNQAGWQEQVADAVAKAPADAELLMLGGVLPSNMPAYPSALESVNDLWATIKPNQMFTGNQLIPFFHFCAYSYILTRAGAKKLMQALQVNGVYTSIDHYLIHPMQGLKMYVLKDLITTCFQASDPVYKKAAFDEFLRVDSYDSDIWNNNECFVVSQQQPTPQPLWPVIVDVLNQAPHSIQTRNTLREDAITQHTPTTVYYCPDGNSKLDATLEEGWLKSLWPAIQYLPFPTAHTLPPNSWLLVARPALDFWEDVANVLNRAEKPFNVLHLSDEMGTDSIQFYNLPFCKKVIRNYPRANLDEKVRVFPLGYVVQPPPTNVIVPEFKDRPFVWGFHGSNWANREELMKPLMGVGPNSCKFTGDFQNKEMSGPQEYQQMLLQSQCVPVPRGVHVETFRLYETLEHGAIPLYVRREGGEDREYWAWLKGHLHLMEIGSWDKLPTILELFRKYPEKAEQYRAGLLKQWAAWKEECRTYFP